MLIEKGCEISIQIWVCLMTKPMFFRRQFCALTHVHLLYTRYFIFI